MRRLLPPVDWGAGSYERMAEQLFGAARVVIDRAAPSRWEHVLDVGCGTGNAALLAAERGVRATGVDPAQRLLDVAAADAAARGLEASFVRGEAEALPLPDASASVVVSVFGVVFARDARATIDELARVAAPSGRIVLSAWPPEGALAEVARLRGELLANATGAPAGPPPFAWHDGDALAEAFGPLGFSVVVHEQRLAFTDRSAREFLDSEIGDHPMWVAARAELEPRGEMPAARDRALEIFEAANEEPLRFRVTSSYIVATISRA